MALGGGVFVTQNKILPGAYINFVSAARAGAELSERGVAALPLVSDWGELGKIITVSSDVLQKDSLHLFGYDYTAPELRPLRELFAHCRLAYLYRLGTGGTAASNIYGAARDVGIRGNALSVAVRTNADDETKKDVLVILDGVLTCY